MLDTVLIVIAVVLMTVVMTEVMALCILWAQISAKKKKLGGGKMLSVGAAIMTAYTVPLIVSCCVLLLEGALLALAIASACKTLKKLPDAPEAEPEKEAPIAPAPIPEPEIVPEPEPEPEIHIEELIRETITIEEAHEAISDDVAMHLIAIEPEILEAREKKKYSNKNIINVDTLSKNFENGELVNLEKMKEKQLVPANTDFVKVLARGMLDKHLTVEAQDYSADAVKMIVLTGGKAIETA